MGFITDKQTLDDLTIFGKRGAYSIYHLFCPTYSNGGASLMEEMLRYPLNDKDKINNRSDIIRFFQENSIDFPFAGQSLDGIDKYLQYTDSRSKLSAEGDTLNRKFQTLIGAENEYEFLHTGVKLVIDTCDILNDFLNAIRILPDHKCYQENINTFEAILHRCGMISVDSALRKKRLTYAETAKLDKIFRFEKRDDVEKLLRLIFLMDVFISAGRVVESRGFVFAKATDDEDNTIVIKGLYHPQLEHPVKNDLYTCYDKNMVFLTGANMAGKSTLMKAFGISIFLAHAGFPVPADHMEFAVQDGIFTTINLPDNIQMGYSHFYAEVMRVKKIAHEVARNRKLIIVFDELFRGTNVKDAYDASLAVTEAFAKRDRSTFIISTHVIEVGEALVKRCGNVQFLCLPTTMEGDIPSYTYTLREGVSEDRHGMIIIRNEKILDILTR